MAVLRVRGMGYSEIARHLEALMEDMVATDPDTGARVLTTHSLDQILENCDDPDHAVDPLGQALYSFITSRNAKIVLPDS